MGGSGYASSGSDKEDEDPSMVTQSAARGNRDMGVRMVTHWCVSTTVRSFGCHKKTVTNDSCHHVALVTGASRGKAHGTEPRVRRSSIAYATH